MWQYEKKLQYPVKIANPNPALAKVIISQLGGADFNKLYIKREAVHTYYFSLFFCSSFFTLTYNNRIKQLCNINKYYLLIRYKMLKFQIL